MPSTKEEPEPEVVIAEPVEEPFPAFEETEHPLLDGDAAEYQGAPATAGLDYPEPGAVEEDPEATPVAKSTKEEKKS